MLRKLEELWKGISLSVNEASMDCEGENAMNKEEKKSMIALRQDLISAIITNSDTSDIIKNAIEIETTDFSMKYALLNVKLLVGLNNQSVKSLQNIVSGLSTIAKYAQLLLQKKDSCKTIPLSNDYVQSKILPLNGSQQILHQLGYSDQTATTISFPPDKEPDSKIIVNLLADMLLFKAEMKYYLSGSHISPQQIDELLPPTIVAQLNQGGDAGTDILDTSVSLDIATEIHNEIVTMQDFFVQEKGGSETTSLKTPSSGFKISCSLCNEEAQIMCKECMNKLLCENCTTDWHSHPSRRNHPCEKISDIDPTTNLSIQDNIVKGPYGIIAQTENPAVLISKKMQPGSVDKLKRLFEAPHGEEGPEKVQTGGNMPNFGSIMGGTVEVFTEDRNRTTVYSSNQQQSQSPRLFTRSACSDRNIKNEGTTQRLNQNQMQYQQQQQQQQIHGQQYQQLQQHNRQQQYLSQFLQDDKHHHNYSQHQQQQQQYQNTTLQTPQSLNLSTKYSVPQTPLQQQQQQYQMNTPQTPQSVNLSTKYSLPQTPLQQQQQQYQMNTTQTPQSVNLSAKYSMPQTPSQQQQQCQMNTLMYSLPQIPTMHHHQQPPPLSSHLQQQQHGRGNGSNKFSNQMYSPGQQSSSFTPPSVSPSNHVQPSPAFVGNSIMSQQQPYLLQYPQAHQKQLSQNYNMSNNNNNDDPPVSFPTSLYQDPTTNTWEKADQNRLQHHHQYKQQQHPIPQSHSIQYQDNEETVIQYPKQFYSKTSTMMNTNPHRQEYMQCPNLQMPPSFNPRHSQTYPQLATFESVPKEEAKHDGRHGTPKMHHSFSTPALSNPTFKIIERIKSIPDAMNRRSVCLFKMDELKFEIEKLQKEIDLLMLEESDTTKEIDCKMHKRKDLLKMKNEVEKFLIEMDNSLEVYFPPTLDSFHNSSHPTFSSEKVKPGVKRSPTKEIPETVTNVYPAAIPPKAVEDIQSLSSFQPNLTRIESITDNTSCKEASTTHHMEPPQISLKANSNTTSSTLKWECQHCTYVNEDNSNICAICHRTTDLKQYPTSVKLSEKDHEPELKGSDAQVVKCKNRILHLQREEEKVMMEKKKAMEEYEKKHKETPPPVPPKKSPKGSVSDDKKQHSGNMTGNTHGYGNAAQAAGFSDFAGRSDTSVSTNNNNSTTSTPSPVCASLALERLVEAQACDRLHRDGEKLIGLMKEADISGYPVDAVPIALSFYNPQKHSVLEWLNIHWKKNLMTIVKEVTEAGATREQNNIGKLSMEEAETACIRCQGNLKNAIDVCIKNREELFTYLNGINSYPREDILQVMLTQRGDKEKAEQGLACLMLGGFIERIWKKGELLLHDVYTAQDVAVANIGISDDVSSSALGLDGFQKLIRDGEVDRDRRIRMIMVESKLKSWGRGELVIDILDTEDHNEHVSLDDIVDAVRNCYDRKTALALLQQECKICFDIFPITQIKNLSICECKLCENCVKKYYTGVIMEKHVRYWSCPVCSLPDMEDEEKSFDFLQMLLLVLKPMLGNDVMNLFEDKLRDFYLQKEPSFRWCAHCGNGFLVVNMERGAMTCHICRNKTCFNCKRMWEDQHDGLSCEQFEQWKIDNDPNNQAIGLARHLEDNGIDCPKCKMRYSLAKGGCMHFICPQCGHEFCSGCYESFNKYGFCKRYKSCDQLGFHCHHPRDCFAHLRDKKVETLQELLMINKVAFNTQVPEDQDQKHHCPVMEQKEYNSVNKDEMCGKVVEANMAGLCLSHYKEYLTSLINKHALDPLHVMDVKEMVYLLNRSEIDVPSSESATSNQNFKEIIVKMIQEKLPLNRKKLDR